MLKNLSESIGFIMQEPKFIQLTNSNIKTLKEKLWIRNNRICPILKTEIPLDKTVLDHIHKKKTEDISENKGTVRDSIHTNCNQLEGKYFNLYKRYFGADESSWDISFPDFLRNLADYYEKGAFNEQNTYYVHPTEKPIEPKVSKRNYNKLKKQYYLSKLKKKFPEYPKSGKLTKPLKILFDKFNIQPYN
jgi:hypothetical protein